MQNDQLVKFAENLFLTGDHYGIPFRLRPWQKAIFAGLSNARRAFLLFPRKVGKTYITAVYCLHALLCRGMSQEVISVASNQKQAMLVFHAMREMIRQDEYLSSLLRCYKTGRIVCEANNSFYQALAATAADGYNPTVAVIDELHLMTRPAHREAYRSITTGRGARKNPITIMISTQASNRNSIAYEHFEYAKKLDGRIENGEIKAGEVTNPDYFACLYYADTDQDWHDKAVWHKVNPALGDFASIEEYEEQYQMAVSLPSHARSFRQLYLNTPLDSDDKLIDYDGWKACKAQQPIDDDELRGCWAGLDLAPVHDLSSLVLLFDLGDKLVCKSYFWCNDQDILTRTKLSKVPFDRWSMPDAVTGEVYIKNTGGSSTHFDEIKDDIVELHKTFGIKQLSADKQHAYQLAQQLQYQTNISINWWSQTFNMMAGPTARLEKLVIDRSIIHDANPVMDFCVSCCKVEEDSKENMRPSNNKKGPHEFIDGVVALVMALGSYILDQEPPSLYD